MSMEGAATIKSVERGNGNGKTGTIQSVADILDRELKPLISDWFAKVEKEPELTCISLNFGERRGTSAWASA
jgi:hypothetical protein